ncbi:MAG: MFS transporter, partial [Acidobacteriota bacterium]|nr:MFS transporter [Acidobacteriota bacterium]
VISPLLFAATMQRWGWRSSFILSGILAIVVAAIWAINARNRPEEHPRINAAELEALGSHGSQTVSHAVQVFGTPWRKIFSNGSVRALLLSYCCHGYTPYIYFTWFFIYLTKVRGFTVVKGGLWGSTPFIAMTLMAPLGGWISDKGVTQFGRKRGRQLAVWIGMTASAVLLWAGSHMVSNISAVLLLALSAGFGTFAAPSWWAGCIDLAPNHSGSLSGLMNTCANLAGGIAPVLTAYLATRFSWSIALDFAALVNLFAGLLWFFVNTEDSVETDEREILPA